MEKQCALLFLISSANSSSLQNQSPCRNNKDYEGSTAFHVKMVSCIQGKQAALKRTKSVPNNTSCQIAPSRKNQP